MIAIIAIYNIYIYIIVKKSKHIHTYIYTNIVQSKNGVLCDPWTRQQVEFILKYINNTILNGKQYNSSGHASLFARAIVI